MHVRQSLSAVVKEASAGTASAVPAAGGNLIDTITRAAGGVVQIYNQQRLASENLRRAREGLPPLTYQDVPGLVPTVQAGLDPGTNRTIMLALALGGAAFLMLFLGRKRR